MNIENKTETKTKTKKGTRKPAAIGSRARRGRQGESRIAGRRW